MNVNDGIDNDDNDDKGNEIINLIFAICPSDSNFIYRFLNKYKYLKRLSPHLVPLFDWQA